MTEENITQLFTEIKLINQEQAHLKEELGRLRESQKDIFHLIEKLANTVHGSEVTSGLNHRINNIKITVDEIKSNNRSKNMAWFMAVSSVVAVAISNFIICQIALN